MITPRVRRCFSPSQLCSFWFTPVLILLMVCPQAAPATGAPTPQKLKPRDPYALIFGTVWGPDDRPVYGIRVKIRRAKDKHAKWELMSDHSGEFAQRVPAGEADYVIWADLKGVKTVDGQALHLVKEVDIHVEYDERVDIGLHLSR
ncbi:MAG: hypothetical protein WB510_15640 [Candidatus Sulfotelmatobacter sp.]